MSVTPTFSSRPVIPLEAHTRCGASLPCTTTKTGKCQWKIIQTEKESEGEKHLNVIRSVGQGKILHHGVSLSISQHLSSFLSLIEASAFRLRCTRRCSARGWVAWNQEHRKWQDSARYFRQLWSCASLDRFVFQCPSAILSFAGAVVVQGHILNLPIKKVHVNIYIYIYLYMYMYLYIYIRMCVYVYIYMCIYIIKYIYMLVVVSFACNIFPAMQTNSIVFRDFSASQAASVSGCRTAAKGLVQQT